MGLPGLVVIDISTDIYNLHNTGPSSIIKVHKTMEEQGRVKALRIMRNLERSYGCGGI